MILATKSGTPIIGQVAIVMGWIMNGIYKILDWNVIVSKLRITEFIFLFRQFYLSLPRSLEEAAAVDGCTPVMTFFRIAFPASSSSVVVTVVLSVVWHWNDFYEPGIYLTDSSEMLLPMLLPKVYTAMQQAQNSAEALISGVNADIFTSGVAMAATFLAVLPILIFYFFFQKRFRQGIESSGITGE